MQHFFRRTHTVSGGRTARGLAGAFGATALALGLLAATAAPASLAATSAPTKPALTAESFDLVSGPASFSSGGHTWQLEVSALGGQSTTKAGTNLVTFEISTPYLGGTESHDWDTTTPAPASDLSVTSSGSATLSTGSYLSPVAAFSVKFTPTSHTAEACATGKGTVYKGVLSGQVKVNTGLHGVGVSKKLTFNGSQLIVNPTCVLPSLCSLSIWEAGSTSPGAVLVSGYQLGVPGKILSYTSVGKFDATTTSKVLERSDLAFIKAPVPAFDSSTKTLTVSSSASGIVTGAGTIAHSTEEGKPFTGGCKLDGQSYSYTVALYEGKFTASKTFVAHTLLTGTLTGPKSGTGGFEIITLKKK